MGFHHVALATADTRATHLFYTEAMGFSLAKAVVAPTPDGGWAKHLFYETGPDGLIAFWELHDDALPAVGGALSRDVGLPEWVNHLAFDPGDAEQYELAKKRWLDLGLDVIEIDHEFCRSIYTIDPNGTMVEWCLDSRPLDERDRAHAAAVIFDADPEMESPPVPIFHEPDRSIVPPWKAEARNDA